MSNKIKGPAPICCGQDSRWVVNSFDLQYWYCGECKQEAKDPVDEKAFIAATKAAMNEALIATYPVVHQLPTWLNPADVYQVQPNDTIETYYVGNYTVEIATKSEVRTVPAGATMVEVNQRTVYDRRNKSAPPAPPPHVAFNPACFHNFSGKHSNKQGYYCTSCGLDMDDYINQTLKGTP